jgi:hypothetical protein
MNFWDMWLLGDSVRADQPRRLDQSWSDSGQHSRFANSNSDITRGLRRVQKRVRARDKQIFSGLPPKKDLRSARMTASQEARVTQSALRRLPIVPEDLGRNGSATRLVSEIYGRHAKQYSGVWLQGVYTRYFFPWSRD